MAKPIITFSKADQFFTNSGVIASGYQLFIYEAGTSTKLTTYTDSTKATSNDNPMILNSSGRLDNDIYIAQSAKFVLATDTDTDPPTSPIWTVDNIVSINQLWQITSTPKTDDYTTLETDIHKLILFDVTSASKTASLLAASTAGAGYLQTIKKVDSSTNTVTIDPNSSENMDGTGHSTIVLRNQNDAVSFMSDGTNWKIISLYFGEAIQDGSSVFTFSKGITVTSGTITLTSGNLVLTSGNATLTSGDLTLTSGNLNMTLGDLTMTDGNLTLSSGNTSITDEDSRTNTVDDIQTLTSTTSGTPAAGIGIGTLYRAESADESPSEFGRISFAATDVTAASEDTDFTIQTRVAGAALSDAYKFRVTDTSNYIVTGAPSAERTITFPDYDFPIGRGWEYISETTASGATSVEFTSLSTSYNAYMIIVDNLYPATDNTDLYMTVSNNNGSSYGSTNYHYGKLVYRGTPATANQSATGAAKFNLIQNMGNNNDSAHNYYLNILLTNPAVTSQSIGVDWRAGGVEQTDVATGQWGFGICQSTTAVNAVKFAQSSGNINGRFILYGIRT
ncbi:MAG: hypothetical protein ACFFD1_00055 [Candidatus Thorarchaeota archaeon]